MLLSFKTQIGKVRMGLKIDNSFEKTSNLKYIKTCGIQSIKSDTTMLFMRITHPWLLKQHLLTKKSLRQS